jgi:hypothetical protein
MVYQTPAVLTSRRTIICTASRRESAEAHNHSDSQIACLPVDSLRPRVSRRFNTVALFSRAKANVNALLSHRFLSKPAAICGHQVAARKHGDYLVRIVRAHDRQASHFHIDH